MILPLLALAAFVAVEVSAIQRALGNSEHAALCLAVAAALVVAGLVDLATGSAA